MAGFTKGMKSSNSNEWATPIELFKELDREFHFTIDVASTHENALCEKHYTKEENGLIQEWRGNVWLNPPYGREIKDWVRKAATDNPDGVTVVLVPARTDTAWWHDYVVNHATEVRFIRGRLRFNDYGGAVRHSLAR